MRKVPPAELRTLFPDARLRSLRLTPAPPSRGACQRC